MSLLQTAIRAAEAAGEVLRQAQKGPLHIQSKGFRDIVTDADLMAERAIVDAIHADFPDHAILSEEGDAFDADGWVPPPGALWIIDPLDGTTNYAHGIPAHSTSVAVMVDGVVEAGAIMAPAMDLLFAAARGRGATLNGQPVKVSDCHDFADAVAACDWPRDPQKRTQVHAVAGRIMAHCRTLRCHGSAALNLAYVAAGWYDLYFHLQLKPWDLAAGLLMLQEAGGQVTGLGGGPFDLARGDLMATNGLIHQTAVEHARVALR